MARQRAVEREKSRKPSIGQRARKALGRREPQRGLGRIGWEQILMRSSPHIARAAKPDRITGRSISPKFSIPYLSTSPRGLQPFRPRVLDVPKPKVFQFAGGGFYDKPYKERRAGK